MPERVSKKASFVLKFRQNSSVQFLDGLNMAWWTHLLFLGTYLDRRADEIKKEEPLFSIFRRVVKDYLYEHLLEILYLGLGIITYVYLVLSIITFFFESDLPQSFSNIIEIFSEPYLGVLGIYVVVKEIERRRGRPIQKRWGDLFAVVWFVFLVSATLLTYFSEYYHVDALYKTVVTNAMAALIIRIGTILR